MNDELGNILKKYDIKFIPSVFEAYIFWTGDIVYTYVCKQTCVFYNILNY